MKKGFWDPDGASPYAFLVAIGRNPLVLIAFIIGAVCLYFATR